MAYQALYRTYRPQTFYEVVGQEVIVKTLQNAIINHKISHAYLFSGPRGTGKTSIARIFAKALNCLNTINGEPCEECISCKEIEEVISPDVIEIDAASNNGVDEIRDIREKVKFLPSGSKYKIYIIDEVHMLSGGAFNALLKTLEEPPSHVIFILATTEPQKLPSTIISRCQKFEFKNLSKEEISSRLKMVCEKENITIDEEATDLISEASAGGMRDALSILDQVVSYGNVNITAQNVNDIIGTLNIFEILDIAKEIEERNVVNTIKKIDGLVANGKEVSKIINCMIEFYRDVILYKNVGDQIYPKYIFEKVEFQEFAKNCATNKILYYIDILSDVSTKIRYTVSADVYLEIAFIKLCNVSNEQIDIIERMNSLEAKINDIDYSNVVVSSPDGSNEKIAILESKVNQVVNELNRLGLNKIIQKVDDIAEIVANRLNNMDEKPSESNQGLTEIQSELDFIKQQYNSVITKLDDVTNIPKQDNFSFDDSTVTSEVNDLKNKFAELSNKLNNINLNNTDGNHEDNQLIRSELEKIKNEIDINFNNYDIKERVDTLSDDVYKLKLMYHTSEEKDSSSKEEKIDNGYNSLLEKMSILEKILYQLMAGELSQKSNSKKKEKKPAGQIMLFADEIVTMDDYHKVPKENFDFAELTKENISEEVEEEVIEDSVAEEIVEEKEVLKPKEKRVYEDDHLNVIVSANSTLVIDKNKTSSGAYSYDTGKSILEHERQEELFKPTKEIVTEDIIIPEKTRNSNIDKFANYRVEDIAQVLHDSRTIEAKNDKIRVEKMWKVLNRGIEPADFPIAELLQEGTVAAVGNKEIIIVYDTVLKCNQVMRRKFKISAMRILYDSLGDTYNYVALPRNIWELKSQEYRKQYVIGIKYPKLRQFDTNELIVHEEELMTKKEETVNKTIQLFGKDIVEID